MKLYLLILCSLVLMGCQEQSTTSNLIEYKINGRSEDNRPLLIYAAKAPTYWVQENIAPQYDTMKPICAFVIGNNIRITIHNFPFKSENERVPPVAQVQRWKQQLSPIFSTTETESQAGFAGLFFCGEGSMNNTPTTVLAWAMSLAAEHTSTLQLHLQLSENKEMQNLLSQTLADYTIKAVGPSETLSQYKNEIIAFAHSFRILNEIPNQ